MEDRLNAETAWITCTQAFTLFLGASACQPTIVWGIYTVSGWGKHSYLLYLLHLEGWEARECQPRTGFTKSKSQSNVCSWVGSSITSEKKKVSYYFYTLIQVTCVKRKGEYILLCALNLFFLQVIKADLKTIRVLPCSTTGSLWKEQEFLHFLYAHGNENM